jgi:hypothetical protein
MNERMQELAEQAGMLYMDYIRVDSINQLEKFAELIVQECANICWNQDFVTGSGYAEAIEKHFGVE